MTAKTVALIVAAGRGSRLSTADNTVPKQYRQLAGETVLSHTLRAFLSHNDTHLVQVVIHCDDHDLYEKTISHLPNELKTQLLPPVDGGATRQASVRAGLHALHVHAPDFVLVHDAARPFVTGKVITSAINALTEGKKAALAAVPVFDTLKRHDPQTGQLVTVDRSHLWAAQTPQGFVFSDILNAHDKAEQAGKDNFTDDTAVAEWAGLPVVLTEGDADNFKITSGADLDRARKRMTMTSRPLPRFADLQDIRHGTGYDVHAFEPGSEIILGGIAIPHDKKLKGHSDADVVLHALTDAILGAIGDGDIGAHFPPSDPKWKGAASDRFLQDAIRRVQERGGRIAHLDATIVCEEPKIGPHREALRQSVACICDLAVDRVSIKATTSERLGFTGRREGIATLASATVRLPLSED